jgi:hypothetical protein
MVQVELWGVAIESDLGVTWLREGYDVWFGTEGEARKRALQRSNDTDMHGLKVEARRLTREALSPGRDKKSGP